MHGKRQRSAAERASPHGDQAARVPGRCSGVLSAAKREWEQPDPDSWFWPVIGAAVSILVILVLAGLVRNAVHLSYDESGSGCRSMTETSSTHLAWAMVPVRILVIAWVIGSALGLAGKLSADAPERLTDTRKYAVVGSVLLSLALMLFVGTNILATILPWVVLAGFTLVFVALGCLLAPVSRGLWLWLAVTWLLATGILLPVALVAVTRTQEILSC